MNKLSFRLALIVLLIFTYRISYASSASNSDAPEIAFTINTSESEICVVTTDTKLQKCIPQSTEGKDNDPIWSPDGEFLLYFKSNFAQSNSDNSSASYIYEPNSGSSQQLSIPLWGSRAFGWSPDGSQLVLIGKENPSARRKIYIVEQDGSKLQALTDGSEPYYDPSWSPDGKYIAYVSGTSSGSLHIITLSTGIEQKLSQDLNINQEEKPVWSPDGTQIAFVALGERTGIDRASEIYLVNSDGTHLRRLTETGGVNYGPRWSPDGKQLVFCGYNIGAFDVPSKDLLQTEIFRINADSSNLINLTKHEGPDADPDWSPDGQWIAFASVHISDNKKDVQSGIFIMQSDGSDLKMVTNLPLFNKTQSDAHNPIWRPIPHP